MRSEPSWTIVPLPVPSSLDAPDAWALIGAAEVQHELKQTIWGHADLHLPAEMRLASMHDQLRAEKRGLVAVSASASPSPHDVVGVALVEMERVGNSHLAHLEIAVRPELLRTGIGTALADAAEAAVAAAGRTTVVLEIDHAGEPAEGTDVVTAPTGAGRISLDAPGVTFASGRGYSLEQGERFSTLHLPLADDGLVEALHAESLSAAGCDYEVLTWQDTCPEELVGEMAQMATLMSTSVPVAGLDLVEHTWTVDELRQQEVTNRAAGRGTLMTAIRHRPSGRLVAYSEVNIPVSYREVAFQEDTLVAPAHRGHRLGMLMKTKNLIELRDLRPELDRLHTWNAEENRHMLSINEALGFEPAGVIALWQKRLA